MFIDLNGFKAISDQHGHAIGDQVLVLIAERLKQMCGAADTVARIGGDEFVLMLDATPAGEGVAAQLHDFCQQMIEALAEPFCLGKDVLQVGSSLGVAVFPQHATGMDTLLHAADLAMYEAKRSGNNQYRLGSPGRVTTVAGQA